MSSPTLGFEITRVDVGVLQQQRAQARVLERVAEAPHAVAVDVGDGADRADREVARGVADAHRRARAAAAAAGNGPSGSAGAASTWRRPGGRAPARASRAASPRAQAGDRQRLGERQHAPDRAMRARRSASPRGASGGLPRIASIGVASTVLPPYSPIDSEIAPGVARPASRQ